jgi:hypothetical protein
MLPFKIASCLAELPPRVRGEFMFSPERRNTRRRKLHLDLRFRRQNELIEDANGATSDNVSTSGVYFISSVPVLVGENIEVSMTMPRKLTGEKSSKRPFTGRVKHVNLQGAPAGYSRIGVLESQRE